MAKPTKSDTTKYPPQLRLGGLMFSKCRRADRTEHVRYRARVGDCSLALVHQGMMRWFRRGKRSRGLTVKVKGHWQLVVRKPPGVLGVASATTLRGLRGKVARQFKREAALQRTWAARARAYGQTLGKVATLMGRGQDGRR